MSILKVGLLLTALTAILVWIGNLVGGTGGMIVAFAIALAMNIGSYWFSDKLVLKMTKARPVSPSESPDLHRLVEDLAQRAGVPKPAFYVVDDPSPNAFATGRNPEHAAVAVNTGLLRILQSDEVRGVLAHEIAHIKHRDTLTMAIVATIAGAISMLAFMARIAAMFGGSNNNRDGNPLALLVAAIFAPIAAAAVQMTVSRAREYEADRLGAEIAGTPRGLANALLKLDSQVAELPTRTMSTNTAHLAIVNPFGRLGGIATLFSTHPPVAERVRRLNAMGS